MIERVSGFIADPASASFEELALAAFVDQFERVAPYRRMCERRRATPAQVGDWREIPPVPAAAFESLALAAGPARELGGDPASPFPDLRRQVIDASFPRFCLPQGDRLPMLSLVPAPVEGQGSSLTLMIDHVLARFGAPQSLTACGPRGVEAAVARSWAAARQREGRPVLILATSIALAQWLDSLERLGLRFRLPAGSAVLEVGGAEEAAGDPPRDALLAGLAGRLLIESSAVVREYARAHLASRCYTAALLGGDPELYTVPHWMRARVLDPVTLSEAPAGTPGLLGVFDLANLGSAVHLLSDDLALAEPGGFRLLGRAEGDELRASALVIEELGGSQDDQSGSASLSGARRPAFLA